MVFRPVNRQFDARRPMTLMSGVFSGNELPDNPLRLRVVTVIEFTSDSQMFESVPSPIDPMHILLARHVLAWAPDVMENGKHNAKLKSIVKKLGPLAKQGLKLLWSNRAPLGAALTRAFV